MKELIKNFKLKPIKGVHCEVLTGVCGVLLVREYLPEDIAHGEFFISIMN